MAINYNDIISQAKKEWADAYARGDRNAMNIAHLKAENARKAMGYSGGPDGSQKIAIDPSVQQKYDNAYKIAYSYAGNHNIDPRYIDDYANNNFTRSNAIVQGAIKNKANAYDIDDYGNYTGNTKSSSIFTPTSDANKYSANTAISNNSANMVPIQQRPIQQRPIQQNQGTIPQVTIPTTQPTLNTVAIQQLISQDPELRSLLQTRNPNAISSIEQQLLRKFNEYAVNPNNSIDTTAFMANLQELIRLLQAQLQ